MAETNGVNFSMYTGDTHYLPVPVTDNGVIVDLTGTTVKWVIQRYETSTTSLVYKDTVNGGITITNPASGVFTINLLSNDTKNLVPGDYYHEASVIDASQNVSTIMTGIVTLIRHSKNM